MYLGVNSLIFFKWLVGSYNAFAHVRPKMCSNEHFHALLTLFRRNKSEFWCRLITVDESWIRHYTLEIKIQSKQWIVKG